MVGELLTGAENDRHVVSRTLPVHHGLERTSAMRLLNVPAACRSFRSDGSLSGAHVVVVRLNPKVGALGTVVTFQRATAAATGAQLY